MAERTDHPGQRCRPTSGTPQDLAADLLAVLAEYNAPLDLVARSGPFEDEFRMGFTMRRADLGQATFMHRDVSWQDATRTAISETSAPPVALERPAPPTAWTSGLVCWQQSAAPGRGGSTRSRSVEGASTPVDPQGNGP